LAANQPCASRSHSCAFIPKQYNLVPANDGDAVEVGR